MPGACLALVAVGAGELETAGTLVRDAERTVSQSLSDVHFVAMFPALARARAAAASHRWTQARQAARSAVELARRGASRVETAGALLTLATIIRTSAGQVEDAERAPGEPDDLARGRTAGPAWQARPGDPVAEARRLAGEARILLSRCPDPGPLVASWLADQRAPAAPRPQPPVGRELTQRELDILRLLPGPLTQRQLAATLFVSPSTLKTHLRAINRKLGVESRAEAVDLGCRRGLA